MFALGSGQDDGAVHFPVEASSTVQHPIVRPWRRGSLPSLTCPRGSHHAKQILSQSAHASRSRPRRLLGDKRRIVRPAGDSFPGRGLPKKMGRLVTPLTASTVYLQGWESKRSDGILIGELILPRN